MKFNTWFLAAALMVVTSGSAFAGARDGQASDPNPCSLDPWCADADEDGVPDAADPCPKDAEDLCTLPPVG